MYNILNPHTQSCVGEHEPSDDLNMFLFSDSKPSLRDLTILKTHSGDKIEIIKSLAPDWKGFGVFLNFDDVGAHLALIEARHGQMNPLACCRDMLTHWVSGNGEQPTTWRTLVDLLVDCERTTLAEQIRQTLSS